MGTQSTMFQSMATTDKHKGRMRINKIKQKMHLIHCGAKEILDPLNPTYCIYIRLGF